MIKIETSEKKNSDYHQAPDKCLADNVRYAMELYLKDLDGHEIRELYALFLKEVEAPFFEVIMKYTKGNITHAAKMLGLNRVTLRNKLKKYHID